MDNILPILVKRSVTSIIKAVIHCVMTILFVSIAYYSTDFSETLESLGLNEYGLKTILLYLSTVPLHIVLTQYDAMKKANLLEKDIKNYSFIKVLFGQVRNGFFWLDSFLMLLWVALVHWSDFVVYAFFSIPNLKYSVAIGWKIILYMLPMFVIFLISDSVISRGWLKESELKAPTIEIDKNGDKRIKNDRFSPLKFFVNFLFIAAAIWLIPSFLINFLAFSSLTTVLIPYISQILITIVALFLIYFFCRILSTIRHKKRFIKKMKRICYDHGYDFEIKSRAFKGLLYCTRSIEFIIKTPNSSYAGTFLPVFLKTTILYFTPQNNYRFCWKMFRLSIFFARHKYIFDTSDGEEKIVLLTKEPNLVLYGDSERAYYVYNGSKFAGVTVYDVVAFCNHIDRL